MDIIERHRPSVASAAAAAAAIIKAGGRVAVSVVRKSLPVSRRTVHLYACAGFVGANTLHKTISTTFFLYFACILPAIALGVLNYNNTGGVIGTSTRRSPLFRCLSTEY